jgi:sulfofructose kinase
MMAAAPRPTWDVLGLGCVAVDDLCYVPAYPPADAKVQIRRRDKQCGGLTGTALVAAARFGARCAFGGVLGDDADSAFIIDTFRREGIDVTPLVRRPDARPIRSTIIIDETAHTRTIFYDLAGTTGADPALPSEEAIRAARVLFVDHYGIEGMSRAARVARSAGIPVVADLERSDWPGFDGLLALVDHLIVSLPFGRRWTGREDPGEVVAGLWEPARRVVIVTDGENGCFYREAGTPGEMHHHPAFAVTPADTTGCGDVFHGVYAACLAEGMGLAERLRFASAAGALKATRPGGQAGVPRRDEVTEFLAARG